MKKTYNRPDASILAMQENELCAATLTINKDGQEITYGGGASDGGVTEAGAKGANLDNEEEQAEDESSLFDTWTPNKIWDE